jgi:hypothetical protein
MSDSEITWQESVARLSREKTLVETYAGLLKKYGDSAAIDRGSISYTAAKAEYDGVIAGLNVALARKQKPDSLPDLQSRLQSGLEKREAFCNAVEALLPSTTGQKGFWSGIAGDAVKGAVSPVIDAVKDIYLRSKDDDALLRKSIETQLLAAAWTDFPAIPKAS